MYINSEWKRRVDLATSFTSSSVRTLVRMAEGIAPQRIQVLHDADQSSILSTLTFLREILVDDATNHTAKRASIQTQAMIVHDVQRTFAGHALSTNCHLTSSLQFYAALRKAR